VFSSGECLLNLGKRLQPFGTRLEENSSDVLYLARRKIRRGQRLFTCAEAGEPRQKCLGRHSMQVDARYLSYGTINSSSLLHVTIKGDISNARVPLIETA